MGEEQNGGTSLVSLIRYTFDDLRILRTKKRFNLDASNTDPYDEMPQGPHGTTSPGPCDSPVVSSPNTNTTCIVIENKCSNVM